MVVTGGAGFIGSHLVDRLLQDKRDVLAIDSFDSFYAEAEKRRNVAPHLEQPNYRLLEADIREEARLAEAFKSFAPDTIVHLAARAGVRPSLDDPAVYASVNVQGTVSVLNAARRAGASRVIFGSSSSVYGLGSAVPFAEDQALLSPASPYAATKIAGEAVCASFSNCYSLPIVALRFFTVYGPRQRPDLAIRKFTTLLDQGKPLPIFGDGSAERDYTFVADVVDGICRAMSYSRFPDKVAYRVFNIGSDRPIRLDALVNAIGEAMGIVPQIDRREDQTGDVPRTWADLTRSRAELGYSPRTSMSDGLRAFVDWYRQRGFTKQ